MPVINAKGFGVISINGGEEESLGKAEFAEILKRVMLWSRTHDLRGFSRVTLQFSINELRTSISKVDSNDLQALVLAGFHGEMEQRELTQEEQEALNRHKDPKYSTWLRASSQSATFRDSLLPAEWQAIRQHGKENYPLEYAARKHWFGG